MNIIIRNMNFIIFAHKNPHENCARVHVAITKYMYMAANAHAHF